MKPNLKKECINMSQRLEKYTVGGNGTKMEKKLTYYEYLKSPHGFNILLQN